MLRRHDNAFASHQARNNEHNIEDHDSTLRRIDNLLASRRARNSQHNTEYHNSQHEHGSATDNSDDDLLSDRSSQVRRGRSLRRAIEGTFRRTTRQKTSTSLKHCQGSVGCWASSPDGNAGGDDDYTGWRCYPGVGEVGSESCSSTFRCLPHQNPQLANGV